MNADSGAQHPRPGTAEYDAHVREEIEHYGNIYKDGEGRETLVQPVPPVWTEMEARAAALVRRLTGDDLYGHVVRRLQQRPGARMLSLGSGPGGIEIDLAGRIDTAAIVCTDINAELLALGRQRAAERQLNIDFVEADLNTVDLPAREFDLVFCHASLHHVIELERLAEQICRTFRPAGELIAVDVVSRNGYLMWPENRAVVQAIFQSLPEQYRLNHTAYAAPRIDRGIWEADTSASGMECARSEEILPILERHFSVREFVPYFAICRRFFDTMYGPNYDLSRLLDNAIVDWVWQLDLHYLETLQLRPETFFGIYAAP
jgi:ubiquinone/menaquinone biosynthesis C-methylase UbiE